MKEYTVTISGVEHTLLLSDEDAARYADAAVETKQAGAKDKARSASNKSKS